jgi:hypothetical protein
MLMKAMHITSGGVDDSAGLRIKIDQTKYAKHWRQKELDSSTKEGVEMSCVSVARHRREESSEKSTQEDS